MTDIPINITDLLKRQLVWDTLPCYAVQTMMPKMGLMPGSEEGNEAEHVASHARLNRLMPIEDALILVTSLAGEVIGRAILENQGIEISGDDDPQLQQYMKVVHNGVVAVIANLVDGGILRMDGVHSGFLG